MKAQNEIRIGQMHDVGGVVRELGKVYRAARRGEVDTQDASRLGQLLNIMRVCLESGDLEKRVKALETSHDN